jgi:hypothetical protein
MKTLNTRYNMLHSHACATRVHVVVSIPYTTHNGEGWAKAYLEPEQARELAASLVEDAALVSGTDSSGSPRRDPVSTRVDPVKLDALHDLCAELDEAIKNGVVLGRIGDLESAVADAARELFSTPDPEVTP